MFAGRPKEARDEEGAVAQPNAARRAAALRAALARESRLPLTVRHFSPAQMREACRFIAALGKARGSTAFAFRTQFFQEFDGIESAGSRAGVHELLYWALYERYKGALAARAQRGTPSGAYRRAELVCFLFSKLLVARVPTAKEVCAAASFELSHVLEMNGGASGSADAEHARHILEYTDMHGIDDALFLRRCVGGAVETLFDMRRRGQLAEFGDLWAPRARAGSAGRERSEPAEKAARAKKTLTLGACKTAPCARGSCVAVLRFLNDSLEAKSWFCAKELQGAGGFPVDRSCFEHDAVVYGHVPLELPLIELEKTLRARYADVDDFMRGKAFVPVYDSGLCENGRRVHVIRHDCLPLATVGDTAARRAFACPKLFVLMVPPRAERFVTWGGTDGLPFEVECEEAPGARLRLRLRLDEADAVDRLESTLAKAAVFSRANGVFHFTLSHAGAGTRKFFWKPTAGALAKHVARTLAAKLGQLRRRGRFSPGLTRFFVQNVFTLERLSADRSVSRS